MKQSLKIKNGVKNVSFNLPMTIMKQGRRFVAYTPALDISTSASTEKKVKENFFELVHIFLEELQEKGTTNEVLTELGWKKYQKKWLPPVITSKSVGMRFPIFA
jgi:hypothetical protein